MADHSESHVNRPAIRSRSVLGRPDDLPFVLAKLATQDSGAEEGVEQAIRHGWAEPAFLDGLRAWAERATFDDSLPFSRWAVEFHAREGGPAALESLRSPSVLSVENNRTVHVALEQLNRHGQRIEASYVRPLLDKSLAHSKTWPWDCVFEHALKALAVSEPAEALRLAEAHLDDSDHPSLRRMAIEFVQEEAGLPNSYAVEPPEGMALTEAERKAVDDLRGCSEAYGQIRNGRLSQYFFNSAANRRPSHVAALRAIGFEAGAAAIEEASRLIHRDGASLDRDRRIVQYSKLSERKERRLDELSELFFSDAPRLRFMLRHRELFARIRAARREAGMDKEETSG